LSTPQFINSFARWLNPRRIRGQAILLAICLWGVCAVDFTTPGLFDRAGNIKFQDFLPFYISARLTAQHRSGELYDGNARAKEMRSILGQPTRVSLANVYGPQVGLLFLPLAGLPFLEAAFIWTTLSLIVYLICVYAVWRHLVHLRSQREIVLVAALAFPAVFHFFVRGQISPLLLLCFTGAFVALRADRSWLAGLALGCLIFKPPFLAAIPIILLFSSSWTILSGLIVSAAAQLAIATLYFGSSVMHAYFDLFAHPSMWISTAELSLAPIQMHSLRSFWTLLIPSPVAALVLYLASSMVVLAIAVRIWKSQSPLAIRFSALIFAAVLINPHLFVYDLVVLAPALLVLTDWSFEQSTSQAPALRVCLYLTFLLPLLGPLSRWTHVQLSVIAFACTLGLLNRATMSADVLASRGSLVV
jgi:arabinofuranan 3-O-arabinosyltransferase